MYSWLLCVNEIRDNLSLAADRVISTQLVVSSLVPKPLPDFISLPIFLHGCEIKSGSGLGTRLGGEWIVSLVAYVAVL